MSNLLERQQFSAFAPYLRDETLMEAAWGDFVDPRDFYRDALFTGPNGIGVGTGRMDDREYGKQRPIFETEFDLDQIRAAARILCDTSSAAISSVTNLKNFTMGTGFKVTVAPEKGFNDLELVAEVKHVVDDFMDRHDWLGDLDVEIFTRSVRDGECFVGLWPCERGITTARIIDPEQIQEPQGIPEVGTSNKFGVCSADEDMEKIHGYWVRWNTVDEPEFLQAIQVEHIKRNVDRKIKRGLSDFFAVDADLQGVRKLLRNMVKGASIQAAIPFGREHAPGVTGSQIETLRQQNATMRGTTTTQAGGSVTRYGSEYKAGTVLDITAGMKYLPSPLASGEAANAYIAVEQAGLRSIGSRWVMPEYMISGDASNANYASTMVSESPFVKKCETEQSFYVRRYLRIFWRVVQFACEAGWIKAPYEVVKQRVSLQIEPPQVAARDKDKETDRRLKLLGAKIQSPQSVTSEEGLEWDVEQKNLQTLAGGQPVGGATPGVAVAGSVASLNGAQIDAARSVLLDIRLGNVSPEAAVELLAAVGVQRENAQRMVASMGSMPPPKYGMDGKPLEQPANAGGELGDQGRRQWTNNRKAIADILADVTSGKSSDLAATTMLQTIGLSAERAAALVKDAKDGIQVGEITDADAQAVKEEIMEGAMRIYHLFGRKTLASSATLLESTTDWLERAAARAFGEHKHK